MSETKQAPILMIPGPIEFHEDVLKVMGQPTPSHVAPTFIEEFGSALEGVRKVFLSKDAQPFIIAGSGTMGWDLIATNLCEPGTSMELV